MISGTKIDFWNVRFSSVSGLQWGIPSQPQQVPFSLIETIALDGTPLGPVSVLLRKKWHEDEKACGFQARHAFNPAEHVVIRDGANEFHSSIDAEIRVVRRHYLGPLEVNLQDFRDDQNCSIIAKELRTDFITPERIERGEMLGWVEIPDKDELAVSVMFAVGYVNGLPDSEIGYVANAIAPSS